MKVGVVVFPGSNCDRDMFHVLTDVFHLDAQYYWHDKGLPENIDAVILPGGFSYGDRLRAGVIAAHSPVIKDVQKMSALGDNWNFGVRLDVYGSDWSGGSDGRAFGVIALETSE